jgi:putative transposase
MALDSSDSVADDSPRKRLRRFEVFLGVRLLTCSTRWRLPLFDQDWVKGEFVASLGRTRAHHGFALLAWVLMPEHFHLLLIPRLPESPVDVILNMLKSGMSKRVLARWREEEPPAKVGSAERFWQAGGGHDRNVDGDAADAIGYIHLNPVRRGLVREPTEWPWSSARWYAGRREGSIPIDGPREFRLKESARLVAEYGSLGEVARVMKERFGVV